LALIRSSWTGLSNVPTIIDGRIREQDYGRAQSYFDRHVFFSLCPHEKALLDAVGKLSYCYPDGESQHHVQRRVCEFLEEISTIEARIMIVSHYGPIRLSRSHLLGEKKPTDENRERAVGCGTSLFEPTDEGWKEIFHNAQLY